MIISETCYFDINILDEMNVKYYFFFLIHFIVYIYSMNKIVEYIIFLHKVDLKLKFEKLQ